MEKNKVEKIVHEAASISNVDQKKLDKKTLEVIKQALQNDEKSFFKKLYESVMGDKHGKSK